MAHTVPPTIPPIITTMANGQECRAAHHAAATAVAYGLRATVRSTIPHLSRVTSWTSKPSSTR